MNTEDDGEKMDVEENAGSPIKKENIESEAAGK